MRVALGLGSNLGDRRDHLDRAVQGLEARTRVIAVSTYRETEPVGGPPGQGPYLNAVALVETELSPRDLLAFARELEEAAGRVRTEHWGPRTLDVDLLLCDDRVIDDEDLRIPHPRMAERLFVLGPLREIAPDWIVPGLGRSVEELHEDLHQRS